MGLESATYVSELTISNPVAGDNTSQGDDHLRLLKAVLQGTFPNADKAFRFPDAIAKTAAYSVLSTDLNKLITGDATATAFTLTLPTLAASDDGWQCWVVKIDSTANAVTLGGTINGVTNRSLVGQYELVKVVWSGTAWYATVVSLTGLSITSGTALTAPAVGDELPIYDVSATANRKITLENFFKIINGLTAEATLAVDDELPLYDASEAAANKVTLTTLLAFVHAQKTMPTVQRFTSGSSLTYTTPAGVRQLRVRMVGGGGGGGGATANNGGTGGTTEFGTFTAIGGSGGAANASNSGSGGTGGAGSATLRIAGGDGMPSTGASGAGGGGSSALGGSGRADTDNATQTAGAGKTNTGGGAGGGCNGTNAGSGGGAGEYVEFSISTPAATYTYTVGAAGTAGAAGGVAGAAGGSGVIIVDEYY